MDKLQAAETNTEAGDSGVTTTSSLSAEDLLRAQIYRLLAGFLSAPPDQDNLNIAADLKGDDSEFGQAVRGFAKIAQKINPATADTEFHDLFIGVTRGELLPYGSYYQTGFLNEKPLAILRRDMQKLGVERVGNQNEPEDHIASVLEMMAGFIDGSYGTALPLDRQKQFFAPHVNSWAPHFFSDLESANNSVLYAPLATIGRLFMKIEQEAFEMI